MKKLLLIVALAFFANQANSQLLFKNTTTEPLEIAIVMHYETPGYTGWISQGWYRINPGETGAVSETVWGTELYYYVQTLDHRKGAGGVRPFVVDPQLGNAFTIRNADMEYNIRDNPSYSWFNFIGVKIPMGARISKKLTITL